MARGVPFIFLLEALILWMVAIQPETSLQEVVGGHVKLAERKVAVFQGRLMSPNEVRSAMYARGGVLPHDYQQSWYLCGDVSEEFFRRVANHERIAHSLNIFTTARKTSFAVFVLQIRECQARFLLPFASEKSMRFFEQAARTGVFLSLGQQGGDNALLLEFLCEPEKLAQLMRMCSGQAMPPRDVDMVELRLASHAMMQLPTIPSEFDKFPLSELCLTIVLDD